MINCEYREGGSQMMGWMEAVGTAIQYVEEHITEDLSAEEIAKQVNLSPFYF